MNAQNHQMVQSSSTEAENLENDFDEIAATIWEMGWSDGIKKTILWLEEEESGEKKTRTNTNFLAAPHL